VFWFLAALFRAENSNSHLRDVLSQIFADETLESLYEKRKIAVCVPTVLMRNEQPKIFRTPHAPAVPRTNTFRLVDVCLATSAAPFVLPLATLDSSAGPSQQDVYADGGLWANNPTLIGLAEALELARPEQPIEIVSASAGPFPTDIVPKSNRLNLGLAHWGSGLNALSLISNAQCSGTNHLAHLLCAQLVRLGRKVTLVRLPISAPSEEQANQLRLDAISDQAIEYFQQFGVHDAQAAIAWGEDRNNPGGMVVRQIFESLPPLQSPMPH
jgi:hypothetical protein